MNPPPNEPAPTAPFTDEDRARIKHLADLRNYVRLRGGKLDEDLAAILRALAYIDHVEEALASLADEFDHIRVAVELERDEAADDENWRWAARLDGVVATWLHAAELARAALKGGENG